MTKAEIERISVEQAIQYFEYNYPVVLPDNEVLDILDFALTQALTPLENAYVRWMMELSNSQMAVENLRHPAYFYDDKRFGVTYFKHKSHITKLLQEIRRRCPYLKLYSCDYIAGLLHDEIQNLRGPHRKDRLYGPSANPAITTGKKSLHDQEMEEIDRLLECLKQIQTLKEAAGDFSNASTRDKQRDVDSSIDRVIANAQASIKSRENGTGRGIGERT